MEQKIGSQRAISFSISPQPPFIGSRWSAFDVLQKMIQKYKILFALIIAINCPSCSKSEQSSDTKQEDTKKTTDLELVGKWIRCFVLTPKLEDGKVHKFYTYTTLSFNAEGEYVDSNYKYFPEESPSENGEVGFVLNREIKGKYTITGDTLTLLNHDSYDQTPLVWKYRFINNQLALFLDKNPSHTVIHAKVAEFPWENTTNLKEQLGKIPTVIINHDK